MKLSQQRSRQTRDQIIAAARDLFARQGYEPTSIDQIAAAAKVAKSSVFAHFGDKANLLAALGLSQIEALAEAGRQGDASDPAQPLEVRVLALLSPWLAYFCREPAFAGLYLSQSGIARGPHTDEFMRLCFELEDQTARIFETGLDGCTPDQARLFARGVQALFHEAIVYEISDWLKQSQTPPRSSEAVLTDFLAVWIAGARRQTGS
ncbi:MAG: TetR/AcrR family transcriptional regulator [Rhizobium sp.]|nr:TetR/AcrR family transcriptional regulator [Rhizobium sp.]